MNKTLFFAHKYLTLTICLDQQMRKKLPAWILEGLEKAEREKQKKAEKEEMKVNTVITSIVLVYTFYILEKARRKRKGTAK